jgi:hypothetical protein
MKSLELRMHNYLKGNVLARNRRNQNRAVAFLLSEMHPSLIGVEPKVLTQIVDECLTLNRYWRKTLAQYPELRGDDYSTKQIVEQRKELELGVAEIGVNQKIVV